MSKLDRVTAIDLASRKLGRLLSIGPHHAARHDPFIGFTDRQMTRPEVVALIKNRQSFPTCGGSIWLQSLHWHRVPGKEWTDAVIAKVEAHRARSA
jgi:hypothetical protein